MCAANAEASGKCDEKLLKVSTFLPWKRRKKRFPSAYILKAC